MTVIFKGGTSGNRADALPPVPDSGASQPVVDTATSGGIPASIHARGGISGNREEGIAAMPTGAETPGDPSATEDFSPITPDQIFRGTR